MKFSIPSDLSKIKQISTKILRCLNERKVSESFLFDIKLACEEAVINAIKYGNKSSPNKSVSVDCQIGQQSVVIAVSDEGPGFNHVDLPDPTTDENLLKTGGRGLFLIRKIMDKVEFNSQGNRITMTKFFPKT